MITGVYVINKVLEDGSLCVFSASMETCLTFEHRSFHGANVQKIDTETNSFNRTHFESLQQ